MISYNDILHLPLTEADIIAIIQKAKEKINITHIDNLRDRHKNIQFDCILRGYVGEYAIARWFAENGISPENTNHIIEDEYMDIDFLYKGRNMELKTSLTPDRDMTINNVIIRRDIKLIKREEHIEELKGDVHLQIYYQQRRSDKDQWLEQQDIDLKSDDLKYLYDKLLARAYINTTYFVGWIDKPTLVTQINAQPGEHSWTFPGSKREFWNCKIKDARKPNDLIGYLRNL